MQHSKEAVMINSLSNRIDSVLSNAVLAVMLAGPRGAGRPA